MKEHEISGTTILDFPAFSFITANTEEFIWATSKDEWNHALYSRILSLYSNIKTERVPASPIIHLQPLKNQRASFSSILKNRVRESLAAILKPMTKPTDAFIVNTYLPISRELLLHLSLKQVPQLYSRQSIGGHSSKADRNHLIKRGEGIDFESFARSILPDMIPACFVENYDSLIKETKEVSWPEKPKFVFTSNCFDTDEVFKAWVGNKVEKGFLYFAGQHGNNFGTTFYHSEEPEFATSDVYLTWGWKDDKYSMQPAFVFKTAGVKQGQWNPQGKLLLIEDLAPHLFGPFDVYHAFGLYQEDQFRFVSKLPNRIKDQLIVRLHQASTMFKWSDRQRWQDFDPSIKVESGRTKIRKLTAKSRLVVHSYDSTGILETLALNIPTVCFWRGGFNHLLEEAKPSYQLLKDAGIFFDRADQAAEHISKHWDSIDAWWNAAHVQRAREQFCNRYARYEKRPVSTLKSLLLNQIKERNA
jgi:putative transferase (TIGR04331 family)